MDIKAPKISKSAGNQIGNRPPRTVRSKLLSFKGILSALAGGLATAAIVAAFVPTTRWVTGTGYTTTNIESQVRPTVEGSIAKWVAHTASEVKAGELLIQLRDEVQQMALTKARSDLQIKKADLELLGQQIALEQAQRKEEVIQAQLNLEGAKADLVRIQSDVNSGSFSAKEVEKAKLGVDLAASKVASLQIDRRGEYEAQMAVRQAQLGTAEADVATKAAELELRSIRAPHAGVVYFNRYEPGEVVKPEHILGHIYDKSQWIAKVKVSERAMDWLKVGQEVKVSLSSYPPMIYGYVPGKVKLVYDVVTPQNTGEGVFIVEVALDPPSHISMAPNQSAMAQIDTGGTTWLRRITGVYRPARARK